MIRNEPMHPYSRIQGTSYIGPEGLAKLQEGHVAIVGLGNIGHQAAYHLALLGIELTLVDHGLVALENLATQGFRQADIGQPKVNVVEQRLKAINPEATITPLHTDLAALGIAALGNCDVYLCGLDSIAARTRLNEMAYRMGVPWIDAALDGTGQWLYAKAAIYDPGAESTPCYLCQWDGETLHAALRLEWDRAEAAHGKARGCPNWRLAVERGELSPPTLAISCLGGVIAGLQSMLALQLLLGPDAQGHGEQTALSGREIALHLGGTPFRLRDCQMTRNQRCLFDHQTFGALIPLAGARHELTIAHTFAEAECRLGEDVLLQLHGREMITKLRCADCRGTTALYRMTEAISEAETICACGGQMLASARETLYQFDRYQAAAFLDKTWGAIGLPADDVISATDGTQQVHFVIGA